MIVDNLKKRGLYAERAYNQGHINIIDDKTKQIILRLEGSEFSKVRDSAKETWNLIKEKLDGLPK